MMHSLLSLPTRREAVICLSAFAAYFLLVAVFMGLRPEHVGLAGLFLALFFLTGYTRRLAVCMIPFLLFGMSYDVMRLYPNYMVGEVDIVGIHEAELQWFGVSVEGMRMTLNEYFALHNAPFADFWAGIFYLLWVPAPMAFGIYCFITHRRQLFLRFAWAFLFINFLGFAGYYIHPASPPWFYAQQGGVVLDPALLGQQMGSEAGLARFDALIGSPVFHGIYSRNANVFAAVPSLHSTYCLCAFLYAMIGRCRWYVTLPLGLLSLGICWTAVYTSHHYVIDVILGVGLCISFVFVWERCLLRWKPLKRFFQRYTEYVEERREKSS